MARACPLAGATGHALSACRASLRVFEQAGLLGGCRRVDALAAHGLVFR